MLKISIKPLLVAAVLSIPAIGLAQEPAKAIIPGYWSYSASTILPGSSDGRQCVTPDKIDDFMSGPHNKHYHCTYPNKQVGDGKAFFDGVCVGKHGDSYKLTVNGTYSQTRFNLKGHIQIFGLPAPISIDAKWLGPDCPADAKSSGSK
jgi:hypothetical protein